MLLDFISALAKVAVIGNFVIRAINFLLSMRNAWYEKRKDQL